MSRVAVVTDSAADLDPDRAAALGISVVPLIVSFGSDSYRSGVELTTEAFWARMTAPDAPFPKTAAASPGTYKEAFEACFAGRADAIVCVTVGAALSATHKSATLAAESLPDREIHVVDSKNASMGQGIMAILATELAAQGVPADAIARTLQIRTDDIETVVVLDTLEYLRKGGRISGPQAAIGTILSVKPIIAVKDGVVETRDRIRTRSKARLRVVEYLTAAPIERMAVLHTISPDVESFREELLGRIPGGIDPAQVSIELVGPTVGAHLGPGALGGSVLRKRPA